MPSVTAVIGYLFLYSMAMFSLPFVAFFGVRIGLRDYFGIDGFVNIAWSVIAAVLVVNLIILSYVIKAWHEPDPEVERRGSSRQELKQD